MEALWPRALWSAREAALRWQRQGRRVRIGRPPQGLDFNDLLLGRAPEHVGRGMTCETENLVAAAIQYGHAAA